MMGKGHRDNHEARVKRGSVAFDKKKKRRGLTNKKKCNICGTVTRSSKIKAGMCPLCLKG